MLRDDLKSLLDDADAGHAEARVVRVLSERGAVSANEIARATGLARSTISRALAELRGAQVIVEAPRRTRAPGRAAGVEFRAQSERGDLPRASPFARRRQAGGGGCRAFRHF